MPAPSDEQALTPEMREMRERVGMVADKLVREKRAVVARTSDGDVLMLSPPGVIDGAVLDLGPGIGERHMAGPEPRGIKFHSVEEPSQAQPLCCHDMVSLYEGAFYGEGARGVKRVSVQVCYHCGEAAVDLGEETVL